jgi:hypothetical protein
MNNNGKSYEHFGYISIFKKGDGQDKKPVYTGVIDGPDGKKYQVALWNKVGKTGTQYLGGSVQIEIGEAQPQAGINAPAPGAPAGVNVSVNAGPSTAYAANSDADNDLPF